jgi:hypothetical protein
MGKITYTGIAIFMVVVMVMIYAAESRKMILKKEASAPIEVTHAGCDIIDHNFGEKRTRCIKNDGIDLVCTNSRDTETIEEDGVQGGIKCNIDDWKQVSSINDTTASDWIASQKR